MLIRISKFLSRAGIASRRKSELLILEGRISVNGITVKDLSARIDTRRDKVKFNNKEITIPEKIYLALNKPPGYLSTVKDDFKRNTVMDLVKGFKDNVRLFPVGRLDFDSRGLILLTNDGDFALKITHPRYMVTKSYEIILDRLIETKDIRAIKEGVGLEGRKIAVSEFQAGTENAGNNIVRITIHEGRKRILRKLFDFLGYKVIDLKRIKIGELSLNSLREGEYRVLDKDDIKRVLGNNV
ncbi:MAG TPA: rRNA pseudouridine synthase [Actinobacteria bacterium]|nr:rRNA pseudouridine synthase [Actinomycetota bacterium]